MSEAEPFRPQNVKKEDISFPDTMSRNVLSNLNKLVVNSEQNVKKKVYLVRNIIFKGERSTADEKSALEDKNIEIKKSIDRCAIMKRENFLRNDLEMLNYIQNLKKLIDDRFQEFDACKKILEELKLDFNNTIE